MTVASPASAAIVPDVPLEDGDGGTVAVRSDNFIIFDGLAIARGTGAGNGGLVGVWGKAVLSCNGLARLFTEGGNLGSLPFAPCNVATSPGGAFR
ncbi:hypothetical protein [Rhizobium terrae]|uniref:hypothetical protein n=1 Tax=Rhizobium terrae TaxID=2171756 RepID=UPI0013C34FB1|nr:hypothetical protein [Rhizobium terrae]